MTTLVTGATGFIGSAVVRKLIAAGHDVRAFVRPSSNPRNIEDLPIERAVGDLTDRGSLDRALRGCSFLFHVAADYRLWALDPRELFAANVDGTRNILEAAAAAGVQRAVYTSSVATLGRSTDGAPADETTAATVDDMIGAYKRSKFLAEEEARRCGRDLSLEIVIVNPSAPVGPRDSRPTPTGRMIRDAAAGMFPVFVRTGLNIVHVDDVAAGHLLAFEKGRPGERYVLGGENMTLEGILAEIARLKGRKPPRWAIPPRTLLPLAHASEVWARLRRAREEPLLTVDGLRFAEHTMYFSSARASRELGYAPRPAAEAIRDAVRWFEECS